MSDDELPDNVEIIPEAKEKGEIPVWPNLPDVPTAQRCRAWCLETALDAIPAVGKGDPAANAVKAASVFEHYILHGRGKLEAV